MQASGGRGELEGDNNGPGLSYKSGGIVAGVEKEFTPTLTAGGFFGLSLATSTIDGLTDTSRSNIYQAGVYGQKKIKDLTLSGSVSAAWMDTDTERNTPTGQAKASFHGQAVFATAEIVKQVPFHNGFISPFVGVKGAAIKHDDYREGGAGLFNLTVNGNTTAQLSSEIGVMAETTVIVPQNTFTKPLFLTPSLRVGWGHEFLDRNTPVKASFSSIPAIAFKSGGAKQDRDFMRVKLDLTAQAVDSDKINWYASYDGNIAANWNEYVLLAGIRSYW